MKRSKFTEQQIFAILKEAEAGVTDSGLRPSSSGRRVGTSRALPRSPSRASFKSPTGSYM